MGKDTATRSHALSPPGPAAPGCNELGLPARRCWLHHVNKEVFRWASLPPGCQESDRFGGEGGVLACVSTRGDSWHRCRLTAEGCRAIITDRAFSAHGQRAAGSAAGSPRAAERPPPWERQLRVRGGAWTPQSLPRRDWRTHGGTHNLSEAQFPRL